MKGPEKTTVAFSWMCAGAIQMQSREKMRYMWTSVEVVVVGGGGDFFLEAGLKLLTGLGSAHQSRNSCERCWCKLQGVWKVEGVGGYTTEKGSGEQPSYPSLSPPCSPP